MLIANHNDADDIMQETTIVMYEKFDSFEKGSDFLSWANTIAKYKTLEFLKKRKRKINTLNTFVQRKMVNSQLVLN